MILGGLGTNFHDFWGTGDWLEICLLFMVILGSSQILRPSRVGGESALVTNNPGSLNTTLEILRPRLGILGLRRGYIGYMIHWRRDYT